MKWLNNKIMITQLIYGVWGF